jgi:hypothetical protein
MRPLFPFPAIAVLLCTVFFARHTRANNIQVTNAAITGNDNAQGFCFVQFDVTWQNSWRLNGVVNWDAAWVFVKFRSPNGNWQHALLGNTGHTAPVGSQIDLGLLTPGSAFNATTNPVVGTFIRPAMPMAPAPSPATGVQLQWNYGALGLNYNDIVQVQVFAIEMVYVPQGAFAAGSGGTETMPSPSPPSTRPRPPRHLRVRAAWVGRPVATPPGNGPHQWPTGPTASMPSIA